MLRSQGFGFAHRRPMAAGVASVVLHGGLLVVAGAVTSGLVSRPARRVEWTPIEVVAPALAPARSVPRPEPAAPIVRTGATAQGRRGSDTPQRSPTRAPAANQVLADLKVSYDDPSNFAARRSAGSPTGGELGRAPSGIGAGLGRPLEDGVATFQLPQPSTVSLAQPPRPKHDYHQLRLRSVRQFAGQSIKVLLRIDAHGRVRDVQLLQGVNHQLDQRTIALARSFEFEPAQDADGTPVPGSSRWEIAIVDEAHESIRGALERGYF